MPVVAVTTSASYLPSIGPYVEALGRAGAEARVATPGEDGRLAESMDALLLPGGADVEPARYGALASPEDDVRTEPERDELEWAFLDAAQRRGVPVLAICRGVQVVNVHRGGSLLLDLRRAGYTEVEHRVRSPRDRLAHAVALLGGRLRALAGRDALEVNSRHHQAVRSLGVGLAVTARSPDGVVEGVESVDGQIVGVQCHPEDLAASHAWASSLFQDLVGRTRSS
jgi:putative glutamine amidotransferase